MMRGDRSLVDGEGDRLGEGEAIVLYFVGRRVGGGRSDRLSDDEVGSRPSPISGTSTDEVLNTFRHQRLVHQRTPWNTLLFGLRSTPFGIKGWFTKWLPPVDARSQRFVGVEGIEPTNNAAEQAIRPAVLWRKALKVP